MTIRIPMAAVLAEASVHEVRVDANRLAECAGGRLALRPMDWYRLVGPYLGVRFRDQCKAVIPLALYLVGFQTLILRRGIEEGGLIAAGLVAAIVGLALFLEGLKLGIMPFAETLGNTLPTRRPLLVVLAITFTLGVAVTFAEPAVGGLQAAGALVDAARSPLLAELLGPRAMLLVLCVGAGVGLAAVLGTLRFVHGWSLKPLLLLAAGPALVLTLGMTLHPHFAGIVGLAWDCGAVTTGPVTVPLVLALGIGVSTAVGRGDSPLAGFGIVTIASLVPVLVVLLLGLAVGLGEPAAVALTPTSANPALAWHEQSPWVDVILGARAIVPLVALLFIILKLVLRERVRDPKRVAFGVLLALLGMIVFNLGLSYGLSRLGEQSGSLVPGAFAKVEGLAASPLYPGWLGLAVALAFAGVLGFGSTLAEPALTALGTTVENLTNGTLRKRSLVRAVALGVGAALAVGVLKVTLDLPLAVLLVPAYALALILTFLSSEEFVNVAWDSAGVTTGPVTVPLVLAMGLGFGTAVGATDGFGLLALASVGPVISVLVAGLLAQGRSRRAHRRTVAAAAGAAA